MGPSRSVLGRSARTTAPGNRPGRHRGTTSLAALPGPVGPAARPLHSRAV